MNEDNHTLQTAERLIREWFPRNVAGNWLQPGGQLYLSHQEIARA